MTPDDRAASRRVIKNEVVPTISGNLFRPEPPAPEGMPAASAGSPPPAASGLLGGLGSPSPNLNPYAASASAGPGGAVAGPGSVGPDGLPQVATPTPPPLPGAAVAAANWADPAPEDAPTVEFKAYNRVADGRPAPRVVALGGGHGLSATLAALRTVTDALTAIVTVADNGGSSGRIRRELGGLPPGDLRMALAALCGDDEWGRTWADVLQHRFGGPAEGGLHGHAVGNLLIAALWERLGDPVRALDWVGRLLGARGRVLPMSTVPLEIEALVAGADPANPGATDVIRGQHELAVTPGRVLSVRLSPPEPPAAPEAAAAIRAADWTVLGPGSWFTSVIPHLLVPELCAALAETTARKLLVFNLSPQPGETDGMSAEQHLEVLADHCPGLRLDLVLADEVSCGAPRVHGPLEKAAAVLGAQVVLAPLAAPYRAGDKSPRHDHALLARAFRGVFAQG